MRRAHTICLSIDLPFEAVHAFLSDPANFSSWAAVEPDTFKPLPGGDWEGDMPVGPRHFRFIAPNALGVLDHAIFVPGEEVLFMPMRVMPNLAGTELTFTYLQRTGMGDAQFDSTVEWLTTDLLALKSLLEARKQG
jgi:hypothetical protein